ncbi:MAG: 2-amino-4-hydroxy-6-hydroxymethyldihydropteridine diphosphokinase [Fibrobacter sp.]|nr:2-amino-4-hydroxy-6-hydroxymethyldihydropteridine diphosphokinase [Fibrobacter sp.]
MVSVVLSLGCNLGNRRENIERMIRALEKVLTAPLRKSSLMETEPVGVAGEQPYFYNQIICAGYNDTPEKLLYECNEIELSMGRDGKKMLAPRTADIDILLYGNLSMKSESLTIPHHAIFQRRFCLEGLNQLVPEWIFHENGENFGTLYCKMGDDVKNQNVKFLEK